MAQQTGISAKDLYVAVSTDNVTYTNISGWANSVKPDGGKRKTGGYFTFDGDQEGITTGKREKLTLKVSILYTEGVSDAWALVNTAYQNGSSLYVRYAPKGNTTGNKQFTTSAGVVTSQIYPEAKAESADPIVGEFELEYQTLTPATIP